MMKKFIEPIFLNSVYKENIWGGTKFKTNFNRVVQSRNIGESWEISGNKNGTNFIKDGEFKGITLLELFDLRRDIFGSICKNMKGFPILNKFIDARDKLSLQVHPNASTSMLSKNDLGKSEIWYIVDCKKNSKIIYGIKNHITKEQFKNKMSNNQIEDILNCETIKISDMVYIPSGKVHAILEGILIYEIQQNSDITYRLFDWNRKDKNGNERELQIDKAFDVIDFNLNAKLKKFENSIGECKTFLNKYINVCKININNNYEDKSSEQSFCAFTAINGVGTLILNNNKYEIKSGDSFILPANIRSFLIVSKKMQIIKTYLSEL